MSMFSIQAQGLSKRFLLGAPHKRYQTIGDGLAEGVRNFLSFQNLFASRGGSNEEFWALRDVSFEVKPGEALGLIGRNGAGKSTLLKILSRITEPTDGRVILNGRIGSLLEVGTGFHPELSGRDNVFLSGALLGMKKAEIEKKFDEMVAFAEIEKFIDTPVKRYSSGMFVRLAFAVAAHLEPEILILDEVLAVGDSRFQKKCLGKMEEVRKHGRTILFVSHSMPSIARLCSRALLLDQGKLVADGSVHEVMHTYMRSDSGSMVHREWTDPKTAPQGEVSRLRGVRVLMEDGQLSDACPIHQPVFLEMEFEVKQGGHVLQPFFRLLNEDNVVLFCSPDNDAVWRGRPRPSGRYVSTMCIPGNLLAEGMVYVDVAMCVLHGMVVQFVEANVVAFQVIESADGSTARADWTGELEGVVRPLLKWRTAFTPEGSLSSLVINQESKS